VLERAANIGALGHRQAGSHENRRDQFALHRFAVDFFFDEARQHTGTLAVADQHDAAALIVVRQIIVPSREHIAVA
jgi:hypothetical protein